MKILVQNHLDHVGPLQGAERAILELTDDWSEKSPDIEFVFISRGPKGTFSREALHRGWKVHSLQFPWWISPNEPTLATQHSAQFLADMAAVGEIRAIFRLEQPDIAITNTIVAPWTAIAASMEHIPHVWFAHEYGELGKNLMYRYGKDDSYASIAELSELVVANSQATKSYLSAWVGSEKLLVQHPAVTAKRIHVSSKKAALSGKKSPEQLPATAFRIGVVGHLTEAKNQLTALQALKILRDEGRDVELILAGERDDEYWKKIEAFVASHKLQERVTYLGPLDNPFDVIAQCDLILAPSLQESFGLVILESQYLGRPVIATRNGGSGEIVLEGKSGFLVDTTSAKKIAATIDAYITQRDLGAEHGHAGHEHAQDLIAQANISSTALLNRVLDLAQSGSTVSTPRFLANWVDQLDIVSGALELNSLADGRGVVSSRKVLIASFPRRILRKILREITAFRTTMTKGPRQDT